MGALTFVCATPPVKGQILSISHESIQEMGFMRAEQTSNGESKIKYTIHKLKTSQHKIHKKYSSKNRNSCNQRPTFFQVCSEAMAIQSCTGIERRELQHNLPKLPDEARKS